MSRAQRTKGAGFERAVANDLTERLGRVVKRNIGQARDGGDDITVGPFRIECKARAQIASLAWLEQAQRACGNGDRPGGSHEGRSQALGRPDALRRSC